jgi:hypothetical protein
MSAWHHLLTGLALSSLIACSTAEDPWDELPEVRSPTVELAGLPTRTAQYERLCALDRDDAFFRAVCGGERPSIPNLATLIRVAGLEQESAFALTGNSTSLVKRAVSAVNPRVIIFPKVDDSLTPPEELTALGFVRGEPFAELVSRDLTSGELNFYLFRFERNCDYEAAGCDLASVLTEEIERGWTAYSIYPEEDLEDTALDCRSCHQPDGFGTKKILRMQELQSPWLHWFPQRFAQRTDSDRVLLAQFLEAHEVDEAYGGIPIKTIEHALDEGSAAQLEALVVAEGYDAQPNAFDPRIEAEAKSGESPTWQAQFERSLSGEAISVPYPLADVTDAEIRTAAVESYRGVVNGSSPRDSLLDLREVFSADAEEKLGIVPSPGLDGRGVLIQACSRCHDGRVNPEARRARFNVTELDSLSRSEKDAAIKRLREPEDSPFKMPPWRSGTLPKAAREAAIEELEK